MICTMPETHTPASSRRLRTWRKLAGPLDRSYEYVRLQETLLITAVATILFIRTQLWLTNYPQIGGSGLHIAHLLWGGMFMLIAIGLLLTFLGQPVRHRAAIVGGIGFGFFIDELGKFITSDNNYFYRPAAALIYLIFLGLFALSHWASKRDGMTPREALINAINLLGEAARHRLDERQCARALALLDQADQDDPLVPRLRAMLVEIHVVPAVPPGRFERWTLAVRAWFERLAARPRFATALVVFFASWALLTLVGTVELTVSLFLELGGAHPGFASDTLADMKLHNYASVLASFVAAVFVVSGILRLRRGDRLGGLRGFERALLVSILITQVFSFVESQFGAVFGLAVNLVLLAGVRQLIANAAAAEAPAAPPANAAPAVVVPAAAAVAPAG
jgi:hypothetical protein